MIRLSRRAALAAGLGPAFQLRAEDPWNAKQPSEWTEKELSKILSDSPWARKVDVAVGGPPMGGMGGGGRRGRGGGGGGSSMPSAEQSSLGGGGGMGGGGMGGDMGGSMMSPTIPYVIRWVSAAPVKEAFVRARFGKEADASQQAREYLQRPEPHYVIAVIGPPRRAPQQREGAEGGQQRPGPSEEMKQKLKSLTLLHRKGKPDIHPEVVEVVAGAAQTMVFRFPRTDEVSLEDKEIEFATRMGPIDIKRKFKLKEMVWQGRLAL